MSHSPSSSRSSSPPLTLDPATQALLDSFLSEKAEEEKRFRELAEKAEGEDDDEEEVMMNVDEYRQVIGEVGTFLLCQSMLKNQLTQSSLSPFFLAQRISE